jgi:3-oxoacyl-[acyl-carrier-protein] synthase-3
MHDISSPRSARIVGTGSALPERSVSNAELVAELAERGIETSDDWIVERTGIRNRYLASGDETTATLGARAGQRALEAAGKTAADVDLLIVATSTPDQIFPSTACLIQRELGAFGGAAFDVQAVCAGFVYALATADSMIRSGLARCALVIGAETFSTILDWSDRTSCVLFGDGAGAVVLVADQSLGILSTALHADGRHASILCTTGSIRRGEIVGYPFLKMDGQAVFKLAVTVLDSVAREVLDKAGMAVEDLDWLIPHQANIRILQATARRLGVDSARVIVTLDRHANTSAASVPLALDVAVREGRIQPAQHVLLQGVGGGFAWGAVLFRF